MALAGPPGGLDEMPPDRALICVVDMGDYEAPGYIITEIELADVGRVQPRRQLPGATPATLPPRFAKYARLNSTQPHSAHLSDTIHNQ